MKSNSLDRLHRTLNEIPRKQEGYAVMVDGMFYSLYDNKDIYITDDLLMAKLVLKHINDYISTEIDTNIMPNTKIVRVSRELKTEDIN